MGNKVNFIYFLDTRGRTQRRHYSYIMWWCGLMHILLRKYHRKRMFTWSSGESCLQTLVSSTCAGICDEANLRCDHMMTDQVSSVPWSITVVGSEHLAGRSPGVPAMLRLKAALLSLTIASLWPPPPCSISLSASFWLHICQPHDDAATTWSHDFD